MQFARDLLRHRLGQRLLHLAVSVLGKSAHAAIPDTGIDALKASVGVLGKLLRAETDSGNCTPGRRHRQPT